MFLSILNLFGFLGTVTVNGLANALPINGKTTGQLSDQYPNLFVPAGLTFAVWGVIYVLLAIFVAYQLILTIKNDTQESSFTDKIGLLFFASSIANIAWIFAWHYEILPISLIIMLVLLGCLIWIYLRLNIGQSQAIRSEKYFVHLPFSVYLGWITIAMIANVTALLVDVDWNRFGLSEQFWAVAVIIVGIAIAATILIRRGDVFYCLVVDWALLGILIKRLADAIPVQSVIGITVAGIVLLTVGVITQLIRRRAYVIQS
jgi:hypothetical protein